MTDNLHQRIMDRAYARWQDEDGKDQDWFWNQLSPLETIAVFFGNFNYQVCNGGFQQWWDNGYATTRVVRALEDACAEMATNHSAMVKEMLRDYRTIMRRYGANTLDDDASDMKLDESEYDELARDLGALDDRYYAINELFMVEVNAHLESLLKPMLAANPLYAAARKVVEASSLIDDLSADGSVEAALVDLTKALSLMEYAV